MPRLKLKFYWYKYVRRLDIVGFYAGAPIIRTKYLISKADKNKAKKGK